MPATTPPAPVCTPDYAQQLYEALATTRASVLARLDAAGADTVTAAGAYNVSRHTFADARQVLDTAGATHRVAAYLDRQLVNASQTAANAVALAVNSNAKALAATTAMATAAGNIKAAAHAVDTLTNTVNGVAGVTKSNDLDEPVDKAARAAVEAIAKVAHAVEVLQSLSLAANVEASRASTAAALAAVTTSQGSVGAILSTTEAALAASQAAHEAAQTARAGDLADLFQKSSQFTIAAREQAALSTALGVIDRVGNYALRASVKNGTAERGSHTVETPGLEAVCELPHAIAAETKEVRFFAVPASQAASFDFQAARRAHHEAFAVHAGGSSAKPVECSVVLTKDTGRDVLRFGESYVVFFLRIPKHTDVTRAGDPTAIDFSFPTPPVTASVKLAFPAAPAVFLLPNGAFVTAFEGAEDEAYVSAYQVFHAPADVYKLSAGDELVIANNLTAANYLPITAVAQACTHPETVAQAIERQFVHDMKAYGHVQVQPVEAALRPLTAWAKKQARAQRRIYVVYTNPFATKTGWKADGHFTIGRYADMYGDPFVLARRTYVAVALAVGSVDRKLLQQAANTLSPASTAFPDAAASSSAS